MMNKNTSYVFSTDSPNEINLSNRREAIAALIDARVNKPMTLLEIAWVSGVSWDAVRSWHKGRREPTMGNLVAVAQTLGFEIILRKKRIAKQAKASAHPNDRSIASTQLPLSLSLMAYHPSEKDDRKLSEVLS